DVLDALPHELRERGHEISVVLPFYREIRENNELEINDTGITVDIRVGEKNYVAEYLEGRASSRVQLFFVLCDEFFDRAEICGAGKFLGARLRPYQSAAALFLSSWSRIFRASQFFERGHRFRRSHHHRQRASQVRNSSTRRRL